MLQLQPDTAKQTEIQLRPDTAKQTDRNTATTRHSQTTHTNTATTRHSQTNTATTRHSQTEIQVQPDTAKQTNFFLKVNEFILFKEKKEDGLMSSSVINTLFSKIDLINTQDGAFPL